jgi:hypothetical protein
MSNIVEIPFYGDVVQATEAKGEVWVVLARVCDHLGIDTASQARRLKSKPWACTVMMTAQLPGDGQTRELFCLSLDCLPMWLATIETSRVAVAVRCKLIAYQKECARVLRDHFLGPKHAALSIDVAVIERLATAFEALAIGLAGIQSRVDILDRRFGFIEQHIALGGKISSASLKGIQQEVRSLAATECQLKLHPSRSSAHGRLYRQMGSSVGWGGPGQPWRELPAHLEPNVRAWLRCRKQDAERLCKQPTASKQTTIFDAISLESAAANQIKKAVN